ncbi:tetratricopeptide repeat protein [Streptomyces bobili]|uniref:tetratricopeptide repeat protein n=1 Tax=Streptomyces bobili TaxID=67280 RepID=UPI0037179E89
MKWWRRRKRSAEVDAFAAAPGVSAAAGSNAAGRDLFNPVAIHARYALPADAYAPIPDDAAAQGVSNIPLADLFVGRDRELGLLEAAFAEAGQVVVRAVHGLGGAGKSALAAHWAAQRREAVRWWVTADTAAAVDAGLAALARVLQPGLAGLPAELQIERAMAWLADHDRWLLVLDNVEDPTHIRPLLDRTAGRWRFLITTRRATGWYRHGTTISLGTLDPDDAVELFTRVLTHHGPCDADGSEALCTELGHLALAVEQAAAYCAEAGVSPRAYLDMLARWPATMFAATAEGGDSARTIARIWRITLDRIADTPLAGDIMRILAWYASGNVPRDLLKSLAEPPELAAAVGRLVAYSMVTDNRDGTLTVHRLVQALARTPDPGDLHRQPEAIGHARDQAAALLSGGFPHDVRLPENWAGCQTLLPHLDALTRRHRPGHDTLDTAHALNQAAVYWLGQGALGPAIEAFQRALTTRERVLGGDHPATLSCGNNLACAYETAGNLEQAIPLSERVLATYERVLGGDDSATLSARNNLAYAYRSASDLDRAIPLFERTLRDRRRLQGSTHPDTLGTQGNLAGAYEAVGDLDRAIPLLERTLDSSRKVLGDDHPDTLTAQHNLAGAYESAGVHSRAIPLFERTLEDCERVLGGDHPRTLIVRNDLAYAYGAVGDLSRAIPLYERTLEDRERALGGDHPGTLGSRNNLASAYQSAGDLSRAIPLFERTLEDCERVLSSGHWLTVAVRANLEHARSE